MTLAAVVTGNALSRTTLAAPAAARAAAAAAAAACPMPFLRNFMLTEATEAATLVQQLQKALKSAAGKMAGGSFSVQLTSGTYATSTSIVVPENTCLQVTGTGTEAVALDGSLAQPQAGPLFVINAGAKLIVEGVTLRGGHSKASGGAIRVDDDESIGGGSGGEVHLVNVAFEDNFSEVSGGALFLGANSVARVRGGSFINNEAAGLDGDFGGGAIFQTEDSVAYVDGVLFVNNRANKGSGVMVDFHAHSHISNCMFSRHTASGHSAD
ncbi:hypothetical protein JKP88DRAFT_286384 [Tribonema minus]|uniref:Right handed beta helix domain-containing protein n=1 Tax=Tribonema minus TaxID=303371 RepID=A0A835ZAF6_9STRA|nr:hypothetical protein JKP88DRAFT_286384 [Tribonema minus]